MADQIITAQKLIDADKDADRLNTAVNGSKTDNVTTRSGSEYPSLANAVYQIMQTGGFEPFSTEKELLASKPTLPKKAAKAMDTKKVWLWIQQAGESSPSWHNTGLSEFDQAKNYTDNIVKLNVNIFDLTKAETGKFYNYTNGNKQTADISFTASLIEIESNTEYQVPANYAQQFAFFTSSKAYISGLASPSADHKFTTPANAAYIGITVSASQLNSFMLCKSSEYPPSYVAYGKSVYGLQIPAEKVIDLSSYTRNDLGFYNPNIIDTTLAINGQYVDYTTGNLLSDATSTTLGYYPIKSGTTYQTTAGYSKQFAFFDVNKVYISGLVKVDSNSQFTTPANAAYVRFTVATSDISSFMVCESGKFMETYVPYSINFKELLIKANQISNFNKEIKDSLNIELVNLINPSDVTLNAYVNFENGNLISNSGFIATNYIEIKANTEYQISSSYAQQFAFFTSSKAYISGLASPSADHKFTTPANAAYIRLTLPNAQLNTVMLAESSIFPSTYAEYGTNIAKNLLVDGIDVKTTEIWVSTDLNDTTASFTGKNAIQLAINSITDATAKNRYVIRVKKGLYKVDKAEDFIGYPGYPSMILMKDHVDVVGQGEGNTIIWAELPYNDADIGPSANGSAYDRSRFQTVYNYADDALMKDLTLVAKNIRYTVHIDDANGIDTTHRYQDVSFIFKGNIGSLRCLGTGTHNAEETYVEGGRSHSDTGLPYSCHNNTAFTKPSLWSFKNHNFTSIENKTAIFMQNDGSLLKDKLELIGCSFGGSSYILEYTDVWLKGSTSLNYDSYDHAEWRVSGYGNGPFLFVNRVAGFCLRFKSTTKGINTSVRFDTSSTAYPLLIKNNQSNSDASLYIDGREFIDGYIAQDGSVDLAAQAWGCKDLSESIYAYDSTTNYTSLAKRLGNCSSSSKALGVIVNGSTSTITFNKDYTAMTNAHIIAEINAQLTNATADLYPYGRDYYPEMTDVSEAVYNSSSTYIPKGSVVTKSNGKVKLANSNDKIFGVALDDIPVMQVTSDGVRKGQGRVLKRGFISALRTEAFYVLTDNQSPAIGTRFSVSNGQLVTDVNGKISCDIDAGVISINC
ncbi:hypothetical protein [Acinetobacter gerneri]|uniref:hypothetical protein n=1 Tax=Acinetobacter gerneri TaxID=202952 RepID=UPI0023F27757|nr:hypothetical protein [Acinetobacter gerneri]MCH4243767.1 hypothetical protein [Acinetobacter gerneri]